MPSHKLPPGPRSWPLGVSPLRYGRPLQNLLEWSREYGDVVHWRMLHIRAFLLNAPEDIETVLVTRNRSFIKGRGLQANRQLFGNGLLTSEGESWLRQRRLMQPSFQRDRVAAFGPAMAARGIEMMDQWKDGEVRDLHRDLMRVTLAIAAETLFGVNLEGQAEQVFEALEVVMAANTSTRRIFPIVRHLPTAGNRRYSRVVRELDRVVYRIIAQRRAQTGPAAGDTGRDDVLSRLLAARDDDGSRMSDRQLRDECVTLLLAGHETTALTLSWAAYLLAQHPEAEERLHAELDAALGGRIPTADDLPRLPWTEAILRESMRLYPPAWLMARQTIEECEIHGYSIPRGASVIVSPWVVHRDPRHFPDPERFDPGRWTEAFARNLPRFAYFPFGGGPRLCIGNSFAMLEGTLLLAALGQHFRLRPAGAAPTPVPSITLRPRGGVWLALSRRRAISS